MFFGTLEKSFKKLHWNLKWVGFSIRRFQMEWPVRVSVSGSTKLYLSFTLKFSKLFSSSLLVQCDFHKSEYIIISFSILSWIAFNKVIVDQFGTSTRKHSSISQQTPQKIYCCGRIHSGLFFRFVNKLSFTSTIMSGLHIFRCSPLNKEFTQTSPMKLFQSTTVP